jgi:hypothetical protein
VDNAKRVAGALTRGKIGGAETAEQIAARHAAAQRGGAIASHATERDNPLTAGFDAAAQGAAKVPVIGKALAMIPKAASGLYKASGDVLWKFDDEVKAQRFQHLVDGGMDPNRAGLRVGGELVDYENKSPIAKGVRPVAPFSTWRTKAPLAVARSMVENPGKASALNALFPAVTGGSQGTSPDTGNPYTSHLPTAEFNGATSSSAGALKYIGGGLGTGARLGADALGVVEGAGLPDTRWGENTKKTLRTQGTYGKEPVDYFLNSLPIYQQYLQATGQGLFQKGNAPSLQDLLLSQLLINSK